MNTPTPMTAAIQAANVKRTRDMRELATRRERQERQRAAAAAVLERRDVVRSFESQPVPVIPPAVRRTDQQVLADLNMAADRCREVIGHYRTKQQADRFHKPTVEHFDALIGRQAKRLQSLLKRIAALS